MQTVVVEKVSAAEVAKDRLMESILNTAEHNVTLEMLGTFDPETCLPEDAIELQCISCRKTPTRASPRCHCHRKL